MHGDYCLPLTDQLGIFLKNKQLNLRYWLSQSNYAKTTFFFSISDIIFISCYLIELNTEY